jgi:hypothetical protein
MIETIKAAKILTAILAALSLKRSKMKVNQLQDIISMNPATTSHKQSIMIQL